MDFRSPLRNIDSLAYMLFDTVFRTYSGTTAPYTYTFQLERQPHCPVCGGETIDMQASASQTLQDFLEDLKVKPTV